MKYTPRKSSEAWKLDNLEELDNYYPEFKQIITNALVANNGNHGPVHILCKPSVVSVSVE